MTDAQVYAGAAVIGAVAGMRSMAAPAMVSQLAKAGGLTLSGQQLGWLGKPTSATTITALAVGELIADKLPFIPARTSAGPLVGRAITGGLSGAAIATSKRRRAWAGALFGAAGAIGAAYAFFHLRRTVTEEWNIPNPVAALLEDAVVAGTGYLILSSLRDHSEA